MMGVLVPHPWDGIGSPPPVGKPYHVVAAEAAEVEKYVEDAIKAAQLLREADEDREEAKRYEESATRLEDEAKPLLDKLPEKLADAIRDDPYSVDDASDVAKALGHAA